MITKSDFVDWQNNPVTEAFFNVVKEKIDLLTDVNSRSAGIEPAADRFRCGAIYAFRDVLNVEFYEGEEDAEASRSESFS